MQRCRLNTQLLCIVVDFYVFAGGGGRAATQDCEFLKDRGFFSFVPVQYYLSKCYYVYVEFSWRKSLTF